MFLCCICNKNLFLFYFLSDLTRREWRLLGTAAVQSSANLVFAIVVVVVVVCRCRCNCLFFVDAVVVVVAVVNLDVCCYHQQCRIPVCCVLLLASLLLLCCLSLPLFFLFLLLSSLWPCLLPR